MADLKSRPLDFLAGAILLYLGWHVLSTLLG